MRFKTLANFALASAAALLLSGCADDSPRQLYYWDGAYTGSVYEYLTEEGDAGAQIAALEESLQKAYQRAAKVPPGLHAHLGLLYLSQGNGAKFKAYVEKEAELYPESRDYAMFLLNQNGKTAGAVGKSAANLSDKDANLGTWSQEKVGAGAANLNNQAKGIDDGRNGGKFDTKSSNLDDSSKSDLKSEADGSNLSSNAKGQNSSEQNLKEKQTKPAEFSSNTSAISSEQRSKNAAKTSKTAKGSQNEK
ncbi:hypothetical protein CAMRE0001_1882 [Campylobacter rectus RM3267]|uniref:Lipoprotein n=2 Tax=Campylobacter rectus TaxID=203 RepID=B9CYQ1_CAMRE|nr:DUF4810 domain-containing protein [Campylobacter rectus]EEF15155.1 hypothetical protein CAMRE0001_1882 [Campylobacter rectus RM3267]QCD47676.1 putative lipoprotein [Campylobacter rectus]UEB48373.1 DUF4810 domain-containing protein [Campylobacter rectus]